MAYSDTSAFTRSERKDRNLQRSVANGPLYFAALAHSPTLLDSDEFVFEDGGDRMKFMQAVADHLMPPMTIRRFFPTGMVAISTKCNEEMAHGH